MVSVDLEPSEGLVTTMGMACRREEEGQVGIRDSEWTNRISDLVREEEG